MHTPCTAIPTFFHPALQGFPSQIAYTPCSCFTQLAIPPLLHSLHSHVLLLTHLVLVFLIQLQLHIPLFRTQISSYSSQPAPTCHPSSQFSPWTFPDIQ
ncbi:hypothetical protein GDO81_005676 [Engystomops pustulosus]|uniref:Uncharacterized protein n=1 Tax=Engystomops pustulosus TaxID=76066 RepID=A0AAV7CRT3_ENGPU|nr:hypothetical protein GDO81_005676 [Engystomops pustulosus]